MSKKEETKRFTRINPPTFRSKTPKLANSVFDTRKKPDMPMVISPMMTPLHNQISTMNTVTTPVENQRDCKTAQNVFFKKRNARDSSHTNYSLVVKDVFRTKTPATTRNAPIFSGHGKTAVSK